jgi:hypothetical protein
MCDKCKPIDAKLLRYVDLRYRVTDDQALAGIEHLIQELEAQKKALHPEE